MAASTDRIAPTTSLGAVHLTVADLERLCPRGQDLFAWAEQHLRALVNKPFPSLVPARQANGHCHWHFDGKCAVHGAAPYSCAYFDSHMSEAEADQRSKASIEARRADQAANGLYFRVWNHLRQKGLTAPGGDWPGLRAEFERLEKSRRRSLRRVVGEGLV